MQITDALLALRQLDALAEPRRRHLCMLAADARTDADRELIVVKARDEQRAVRANLEAALKADYTARARWAADNPAKPAESAQRLSKRGQLVGAEPGTTHTGPRPVTVTWGPITRTATEEQVRERKPLMGRNRVYPTAPAVPVAKVKPEPAHGTLTRYQRPWQCRCSLCREVKRQSNARHNAKRADRDPKHGTTHMYNGTANRAPCRCDECKAAKVVSNAKAREQMKLKKRSGISPE